MPVQQVSYRLLRRTGLLVLALFLFPARLQAANGTWTSDTNAGWSDTSRWSGGVVADGSGSTAFFNTNITATRTITLDSNRTIGSMVFSDNGGNGSWWTLTGTNTLTLAVGSGAPVITTTTYALIDVVLAGNQGLHHKGNSALLLSADNVYTGLTTNDSSNSLQFGIGGTSGSITGNIFNAGTVYFNYASGTVKSYAGAVSGGGVLQVDNGTVQLLGSNTYTGATIINGANSVLRAASGVGLSGGSNLVLANGGVFESSGTFTRTFGTAGGQVRWTGAGGFSAAGGALTVNFGGAGQQVTWNQSNFVQHGSALVLGSATADAKVTIVNPWHFNGQVNTIQVNDNPNSSNDMAELSGAIGSGGLIKTGTGRLILSGNNGYTLGTTISAGALEVRHNNALGSSGVFIQTGGRLDISSGINLASSLTLTGGTITAQSFDRTVTTLAMNSGTLQINGGTYAHAAGSGAAANILTLNGTSPGTVSTLEVTQGATVVGAEATVIGSTNGGQLLISGGSMMVNSGEPTVLGVVAGYQIERARGYVGLRSGSTGTVQVSGTNSQWTVADHLRVGYDGAGTLNISDRGSVTSLIGTIGRNSTGVGTATVSGVNSRWTVTDDLFVGYFGNGTLSVHDGATVASNRGYLGYETSAVGAVTISGADSIWSLANSLSVGSSGTGTLNVQSSGRVDSYSGSVGAGASGQGLATISGVNSIWSLTSSLWVGSSGTGFLNVQNGGRVSGNSGYVGYQSTGLGTATITGANSIWSSIGALAVGQSGTGSLSIQDGGAVVSRTGYVGYNSSSNGSVLVTGPVSTWTLTNCLYLGGNQTTSGGSGAMMVTGGGAVTVGDTLKLWNNGTLTIGSGGSVTARYFDRSLGTLALNDGTLTISGGTYTHATGTGAAANVLVVDGVTPSAVPTFALTNGASTVGLESMIIGGTNDGQLVISGGSSLSVADNGGALIPMFNGVAQQGISYLGFTAGSTGTATISGAGSQWSSKHYVNVGWSGQGILNVLDNATITTGFVYLGGQAGSSGTATVRGMGSKWTMTSGIRVGNSGNGNLSIEDGGNVASATAYVASEAGTIGNVTITGAGSRWSVTGNLHVGNDDLLTGGTGGMTIVDGGRADVGGLTKVWSTGTLTIGSGGTLSTGSLEGNVQNEGGVVIGGTATTSTYADVIAGAGTLSKVGTGTLAISGNNTYSGGTTINGGVLQIGNGAAAGSIGAGNVVNNAVLAFNHNDSVTFANVVSGTGALHHLGTGTTILTANNSYSGGTTISAGTLQVGVGGPNNGSLGSGNVVNNGVLALHRNDTITFANVVSGTGALHHLGSGTTILTGNNSYSGITTIAAGTLQVGSGGGSGSIGSGNIINNGVLAFKRSDAIQFTNTITGSGRVVHAGTGTTIFSGTNTYSGGTQVSAGTLVAQHSTALGSGGVTVLAGGRLELTTGISLGGSMGNYLTLAGGTVSASVVERRSNRLTWYFGTLQVREGVYVHSNDFPSQESIFTIDGNAPGYRSTFELIAGAATYGARATIVGSGTEGQLLISGGSVLTNTGPAYFLGNVTAYDGRQYGISGGIAVLGLAPGSSGTATVAGANSKWLISNGLYASYEGSGYLIIRDGGAVESSDGLIRPAANATGQVLVSDQNSRWNVTGSLHVGSDGGGIGNLTISNGGTVNVGGLTRVWSTGTLTVSNDGNLATGSLLGNVFNDGGVVLGGTNATSTYADVITGAGTLSKVGTGTLTISGNNTYSGGTTISGGVVQVGNGAATGSIGAGNVVNNAVLAFNRNDSVTFANVVSGTGALHHLGTGTTILTANNSYSGGTTIAAGTLQVGNGSFGGSLGLGAVVNNGVLSFNQSGTATVANVITGTGALLQNGLGTTILTSNNAYSGVTTIAGGTLQVGINGLIGSLGSGNIVNNGILAFARNNTLTVANSISGTGSLTKSGNGSLVLTGNNSYLGGTTINGGTLVVGSSVFGTSEIHVNAGTLQVSSGGYLSGGGTITTSLGASVLVSSGGAIERNIVGGGSVIITGPGGFLNGQISGASNVSIDGFMNGIVTANSVSVSGRLDGNVTANFLSVQGQLNGWANGAVILLNSTGYVSRDITVHQSLYVRQSLPYPLANTISGAGGVIRDAAGVSQISGSNSYSGGTTISAGTLVAQHNNALGTGGVLVQTDGRLEISSGINLANALTLTGGTISAQSFNRTVTPLTMNSGTLQINGGTYTHAAGSGEAANILTIDSSAASGVSTFEFSGGATTVAAEATVVGATNNGRLVISGGSALIQSGSTFLGTVAQSGLPQGRSVLGIAAGATGTAMVTGPNTFWSMANELFVGNFGTGILTVQDGGRVNSFLGHLGLNSTGQGTATISGANSLWSLTSGLTVNSGTGVLNVQDGGTVVSRTGILGSNAGSNGSAAVTGLGSSWTVTNNLYVGGRVTSSGGLGLVTVANGGAVSVGGLTMIWQSGSVHIGNGGTFSTATLQVVAGGSFIVDEGGVFNGGVSNSGDYVLNGTLNGNVAVEAGAEFGGSGVVVGNLSGAGLVSPGNSPGVMDAVQIDPTSGIDFLFEFTAANTLPDYLNRTSSINDVLHLTHADTPFLSALTSNNAVTVDFQVGSLAHGDVFYGGFFTNQPGDDFYGDGTVNGALYNYLLNGSALDLNQWQITVSTASQLNVDFGSEYGGIVDGRLMQFTLQQTSVPEPGSLALVGAAAAGWLWKKRRRKAVL